MKKRIFSIIDMSNKKVGLAVLCGALILTLGTGFAFATSAVASNNEEQSFTSNQANADLYSAYIPFGLTVTEQTGTDIFNEYKAFGLSYDNSQNVIFYNSERVRLFLDVRNSNGKPIDSDEFLGSTTSNLDANGTIDVYTVRDSQTDEKINWTAQSVGGKQYDRKENTITGRKIAGSSALYRTWA